MAIGNIILLLAGLLQGILLTILFLKRKIYRQGFGFLLAYVLVLLAQLVFKISDKVWLVNNLQLGYAYSYQLPYLYGPLAWLFAASIFKNKIPRRLVMLHLLPFAIAIILETFFQLSDNAVILFYLCRGWGPTSVQVISIVVYHLLALRAWKRYNDSLTAFSADHRIRMRWVRYFIFVSLAVCPCISLLIGFIYMTYPAWFALRWGFVLLVGFIYWISYSAMNQPQLFVPFINREFQPSSNKPGIPPLVVRKSPVKYSSSTLTASEAGRIEQTLLQLMEVEKIYTDTELNIDRLAAVLHTNRHLLSQVLNQRLNQSFYDFVNGYRIAEARKLLCDVKFAHIKISSIAYDAGFNSLSAFNDVFRKHTGTTPSAYRRSGGESHEKLAGNTS